MNYSQEQITKETANAQSPASTPAVKAAADEAEDGQQQSPMSSRAVASMRMFAASVRNSPGFNMSLFAELLIDCEEGPAAWGPVECPRPLRRTVSG